MPQNICRHIRPSGRRCQTPAVRNSALCYFHQNLTEKHNGDIPTFIQTIARAFPGQLHPEKLRNDPLAQQYFGIRPAGPSDIDLPPLEDRESLQIALSTILNALAQNRIDHRRAGTLLYGLQIAVANLRSTYPTDADDSASSLEVVIETVPDEHGQLLCPPESLTAQPRCVSQEE